jgi:hypothetical protein
MGRVSAEVERAEGTSIKEVYQVKIEGKGSNIEEGMASVYSE